MTSPTLNSVSFVVPLVPPSVNNYVRHTGRGGHYKTNEAVAFGKAMVILGQSHARAFGPFDAYRVEVTVHLKGRMRRDVDNMPKQILDGLRDAGFYADDSRVFELEVKKVLESPEPRTEITIIGL